MSQKAMKRSTSSLGIASNKSKTPSSPASRFSTVPQNSADMASFGSFVQEIDVDNAQAPTLELPPWIKDNEPPKRIVLLGSKNANKSMMMYMYLRNNYHDDYVVFLRNFKDNPQPLQETTTTTTTTPSTNTQQQQAETSLPIVPQTNEQQNQQEAPATPPKDTSNHGVSPLLPASSQQFSATEQEIQQLKEDVAKNELALLFSPKKGAVEAPLTKIIMVSEPKSDDPEAVASVKSQNMLLVEQLKAYEEHIQQLNKQLRVAELEKAEVSTLLKLERLEKQELANEVKVYNETVERLLQNPQAVLAALMGNNQQENTLTAPQQLPAIDTTTTTNNEGSNKTTNSTSAPTPIEAVKTTQEEAAATKSEPISTPNAEQHLPVTTPPEATPPTAIVPPIATPEQQPATVAKDTLSTTTSSEQSTPPVTPKGNNTEEAPQQPTAPAEKDTTTAPTNTTDRAEMMKMRRQQTRHMTGLRFDSTPIMPLTDTNTKVKLEAEEKELQLLMAELSGTMTTQSLQTLYSSHILSTSPSNNSPFLAGRKYSNSDMNEASLDNSNEEDDSIDEDVEKDLSRHSSMTDFSEPTDVEETEYHALDPILPPYDYENLFAKSNPALQLMEGIRAFNNKPKDGIKLLTESAIIENHPAAISAFLAQTANINKAKLGEFLGHMDHEKYLRYYCDFFASRMYKGVMFDVAMRFFFTIIKLPPEGQMVTRIAEGFANSFVRNNPNGDISDMDQATMLACAILMLNTDLHNPGVKHKMSKETFIKILSDTKINDMYLAMIYDSIKFNELKIIREDLPDDDDDAEGKTLTAKPSSFSLTRKTSKALSKSSNAQDLKPITAMFVKHKVVLDHVLYTFGIKDTVDASDVEETTQDHPIDTDIAKGDFFFCTYSVSDESTFEKAKLLVERVKRIHNDPKKKKRVNKLTDVSKKIILVGCNSEEKSRKISFSQGAQTAIKLGVQYFETSVKRNKNVKELFHAAYRQILEAEAYKYKLKEAANKKAAPTKNTNKPLLSFAQILESAKVFI